MIVKDRHPNEHDGTDLMATAGARAEAQMAFYLKRAFGDAKDVLVLHDLRLSNQDGSDAAQIDHLVLHTGGMVIIESKSVTSEVSINENHEFSRLWNGRWLCFASPRGSDIAPDLVAHRCTMVLYGILVERRI